MDSLCCRTLRAVSDTIIIIVIWACRRWSAVLLFKRCRSRQTSERVDCCNNNTTAGGESVSISRVGRTMFTMFPKLKCLSLDGSPYSRLSADDGPLDRPRLVNLPRRLLAYVHHITSSLDD